MHGPERHAWSRKQATSLSFWPVSSPLLFGYHLSCFTGTKGPGALTRRQWSMVVMVVVVVCLGLEQVAHVQLDLAGHAKDGRARVSIFLAKMYISTC